MYRSLLDFVGEDEGGLAWENGTETCTLSHVTRITSPCLMHDPECSGLVHWDDPEGWEGRWEGGSGWRTHEHPCQIHVKVWQNQYNIVK